MSRVTIDDVGGGRLATEHLLAAGHTRIGFVGDEPADPLGFTSSDLRLDGYREALTVPASPSMSDSSAVAPHGRDSARELSAGLLARPTPPTAIFAASDLQAIGVLEAAAAAGSTSPASSP